MSAVVSVTAVAAKQQPEASSCKYCEMVVRGYSAMLSFGNVSAQESIALGQSMCRIFDFGGKAQLSVCDAVVNATRAIKNFNFKHLKPGFQYVTVR